MQFDLLITQATPPRGKKLIQALYTGAYAHRIKAEIVGGFRTERNILVMYGPGGPDRMPLVNEQLRQGGRLVAWDAGYWDRKLPDLSRRYRVSIDGLHPPRFIMRGRYPGPGRWENSGLSIVTSGNPNGPILIAGVGPKSNAIGAHGWSRDKSSEIRKIFPGKQIAYRPKPKKPIEKGVNYDLLSTSSIESALSQASLVVCRHSNVAVDACRHGVPVVCDDGAAAAIYPSSLMDYRQQPSEEVRTEFLHRLAWWQWSPEECAQGLLWPWLIEVLNESV